METGRDQKRSTKGCTQEDDGQNQADYIQYTLTGV